MERPRDTFRAIEAGCVAALVLDDVRRNEGLEDALVAPAHPVLHDAAEAVGDVDGCHGTLLR